jgi:hypothetical protein
MITELKDNEIFVFGSNLAGNHAGGAALQAKEQFGAEQGIGEGLTGRCYAFPTLERDMNKRGDRGLNRSIDRLYATARALPEKIFLLTKVGCGIAGYDEEYMKSLFVDAPRNIIKPEDWN